MSTFYQEDRLTIIHGDAAELPLPDSSVDLLVTSPPYFGLRSYKDGGEHYEGQVGDEATPAEFVAALLRCTREWMRVLKPEGSLWVNLGDKYSGGRRGYVIEGAGYDDTASQLGASRGRVQGYPAKSLLGIPWRYALACVDDLGLILRAEVIWSKPNGLPESVTDRVRRSHEQWFHFTLQPRYFSAVDHIREAHSALPKVSGSGQGQRIATHLMAAQTLSDAQQHHPLGKLPGSVWEIATQPLRVPDDLGIDHFAAFPMEWPRRIIQGWSPSGVCVACGEGRRPEVNVGTFTPKAFGLTQKEQRGWNGGDPDKRSLGVAAHERGRAIIGESCGCPEPTADTTPAVVLDPFGGTGTTALVAYMLGRHGISNDLSRDYCRLAKWRTTDPKERARAIHAEAPPVVPDGQGVLL